ncbi:MAG: hypothetical protein IH987_15775 [Planctomycetes bacterium]|nr:hypothetical protein [Planctomycetota bacterium]
MLLVTGLWIRRRERETLGATEPTMDWSAEQVVFGSLLIGCCIVPATIAKEYRLNFSGAYEASLVVGELEPATPIATWRSSHAEGLLGFLPDRKFLFLETMTYESVHLPTNEFASFQPASDADIAERLSSLPVRPWLLLTFQLEDPLSLGYELVYATQRDVYWVEKEFFLLYRPVTATWDD